jgi:hypothetical protein
MKNAFLEVFSRDYQSAILIGSDSPDLPDWIVGEAFVSHLHNHDVVIGPSPDGGYYLIGFKIDALLLQVFDKITWSTPEVFRQTRDMMMKANLRVHALPMWRDMDTLKDLRAFVSDNRATSFTKSSRSVLTAL